MVKFIPICTNHEFIRMFSMFKLLNIFGYSFRHFYAYEYIQIFARFSIRHLNIFGYSFNWFCTVQIYSDIHSLEKTIFATPCIGGGRAISKTNDDCRILSFLSYLSYFLPIFKRKGPYLRKLSFGSFVREAWPLFTFFIFFSSRMN